MIHKYTKKEADFLIKEHEKDSVSEHNSVVVVDALSANYTAKMPTNYSNDVITLNQNSYIKLMYRSNSSTFKNTGNLYIDNQSIGIIKYNPRQYYIPKDLIQVRYNNSLFYNGYLEQAITGVNNLFEYQSISQIDIACDTNNPKFWKFSVNFDKNKYGNLQLHGNVNCYNPHKDTKTNLHTIYFGSPKSDKQFREYIKSNLLKTEEKEYIKEFHKVNNLKGTVYRTELSLSGKYAKAIDIDRIYDTEYLQTILINHQTGYLEFYKMRKKRNKDEKYKYLLPIQVFDFKSTQKFNKYPEKEVKNKANDKRELIRVLFKSILEERAELEENTELEEKAELEQTLNLSEQKLILLINKSKVNKDHYELNKKRWEKEYDPNYGIKKHNQNLNNHKG